MTIMTTEEWVATYLNRAPALNRRNRDAVLRRLATAASNPQADATDDADAA